MVSRILSHSLRWTAASPTPAALAIALTTVLIGGCGSARRSGCKPATCESVGAECGPLYDGCGQELWCGECAEGVACGVAKANQCGGSPSVNDVVTSSDAITEADSSVLDGAALDSSDGGAGDAAGELDSRVDLDTTEADIAVDVTEDTSLPDTAQDTGPEDCVEGQRRVVSGCASWVEETLAESTADSTHVDARSGRVAVCWRQSGPPTVMLKKSGSWESWNPKQGTQCANVGLDGSGDLWFMYSWLSGSGPKWLVDRRPTALAAPFELHPYGEDADLDVGPDSALTMFLVSGYQGNPVQFMDGIAGELETLQPQVNFGTYSQVQLAHRGSAQVALYLGGDRKGAAIYRRDGADWSFEFPALQHKAASGEVSLALDDDGVAHVVYKSDVGLIHEMHAGGLAFPVVEVVDAAPGAGESARIAIASDGTLFVIHRDAEADCRLHIKDGDVWESTTVISERCEGRLDLTIDELDQLHLTYVYRFPSGERHVRYRTAPAL